MNWFYNLKISVKLLVGFCTVAMIAGIVGMVGVINMRELDKSDAELYQKMAVPISRLADLTTQFQRMRVNIRDMIIANNLDGAEGIKDFETRISQRKADIDKVIGDFDKTIVSQNIRNAFNNFVISNENFDKEIDKVILLAKKNKDAEALELIKENSPLGQASRVEQDAIDNLVKLKIEEAKAKAGSNSKQANKTMSTMLIVLFAGVAVAVAIGVFLSSIISKPIKALTLAANKLKVGDINVDIKSKTKDEIGALMMALAKMVDNIKEQCNVAKKIREGDLSIVIQPKSDNDVMAMSMKSVIDTLKGLVTESQILTTAAIEGRLNTRGKGDMFKGGYKDIVEGVNKTLDILGNYIYELPSPVIIINRDFAIQYINKAGASLLELHPNQITGTKCYDHFKTSHCNTQKCACYQAMQLGKSVTKETDAHPQGMDLDISYTGIPQRNQKQEIVGALEFITNQTDIKKAVKKAEKQAIYQEKEVQKLITNLEKLAEGDLYIEAIVAPMDDDTRIVGENFKKIASALEKSVNAINEILVQIHLSSEQVASGAKQISYSGQSLSQGATENASSIEEVTSSMTQVAAQTKDNALNATHANEFAAIAKKNAVTGNEQMNGMLKAMQEINDSSSSISKIIKVIDEIAFQTNILALNAAVEAARAGQSGKGFAVVAEEVRNLAARSANAAEETTALIESSIKKVEIGTKMVDETANALSMIVDSVTKVSEVLGGIAIASNEQASSISQTSLAIDQVAQVVQSTSAIAEESAAASEELSGQSELLKNIVSKFKIRKAKSHLLYNNDITSPEMLETIAAMIQKKNLLNGAKRDTKKSLTNLNFNEFDKY